MKYLIVVLSLFAVALAAPTIEDAAEVEAAQFHYMNAPYNNNPYNPYNQFRYGGYGNQYPMDMPVYDNGPLNPSKYLEMEDDDFPVDYSLPCSNSCGCRQTCMIVWWQPCTCRCPPPCGCNGCTWGCCGNRCCKQQTTTTTTTQTTTTPTTTTESTTTSTTTPAAPEITTPGGCNGGGCCNGGSCCNQCSCSPCMMAVVWMCPPRCGSGCCNSGGSSCCNGSNNSCCGK